MVMGSCFQNTPSPQRKSLENIAGMCEVDNIGSDNSLVQTRWQAIIWTNGG